jgi:hypothetical protein
MFACSARCLFKKVCKIKAKSRAKKQTGKVFQGEKAMLSDLLAPPERGLPFKPGLRHTGCAVAAHAVGLRFLRHMASWCR